MIGWLIKPPNTEPVRIPARVTHPVNESLIARIQSAKSDLDQRGIDVRSLRKADARG